MRCNKPIGRFQRLQSYVQRLTLSYGRDIGAVQLTELRNVISPTEYQTVMTLISSKQQ